MSPTTAPRRVETGRIDRLQAWLVGLPVRSVRRHGVGDVAAETRHVILRLETSDGAVGWGEAAPWPVFTGTPEAALAALDTHLRPIVIGARPDRVAAVMRDADARLVGHPEAKAALEMALFDLLGRAAGLPVAELLGGRCRERIPLSISLADPDLGADMDRARAVWEDGLRLFKVKTGVAGHAFDIARLEALRGAFPDADIRIDYNQGMAPHEALRRLRDLEAFAPTFIEQPVPAACRAAMAEITAALDTPILADESVFTPAEALLAVRDRIADLVSVKIMKSGGMMRGREIAAIAGAAGMAAYGGDMFETGLAHLAGAHMVAATPNISLGCEFYQARYYLAEDILVSPFPIEGGEVVVPDAPGLGIDVDVDVLRRSTITRVD